MRIGIGGHRDGAQRRFRCRAGLRRRVGWFCGCFVHVAADGKLVVTNEYQHKTPRGGPPDEGIVRRGPLRIHGALLWSPAGVYSCVHKRDSEAPADVANDDARSLDRSAAKNMARSVAKRKHKLFYATVQVTRVEEWCVEAESAEESRAQLAKCEGERFRLGDCVHLEVHDVTE